MLLFAVMLVFPASAQPPTSAAELKQKLYQAVRSRPGLEEADIGIYIKVVKTGRVLYNQNGNEPMIPASNLKLVTTAVALDLLGEDYRFETRVIGPKPDAQGVIQGDLILRGTGDPTFCYPYNQPCTEPFSFFVRELKKLGVKAVNGDVIADDSAFDREFLGRGWFDRYLLDSYAAPVGALSLNANLVQLNISNKGISTDPSTTSLSFNSKLRPGGGSVWVDRKRGEDRITVEGDAGGGVQRSLTIHNPTRFTGGAFLKMLEKGGIDVRGKLKLLPEGERPPLSGLTVFAQFRSPPLIKLVRQTNRESDNLFAQHIFKAAGRQLTGFGTAESGEAAVKQFLEQRGMDARGLKMYDGSGLSELDRISPRQLVDVLCAMWEHPLGQEYIDSLPAGGEGTLRYRLNGMVVRAKTGTLKGHSGLSGYVVSSYGQTIAFSVLVNHIEGTWNAIELEDHVVKILASWPDPL